MKGPGSESTIEAAIEGDTETYSRAFVSETLPGAIRPLDWSVDAPLFGGAWARLLAGMTGAIIPRPHLLIKRFYGHAYLNMAELMPALELLGLPKESLSRLMGKGGRHEEGLGTVPQADMLLSSPISVNFLLHLTVLLPQPESLLPARDVELRHLAYEDLNQLSEEELLRGVDSLIMCMEDAFYLRLVTSMASDLFESMLQARLGGAGLPRDTNNAKSDALQLVPRKDRRLVLAALRRATRASISMQRAVDTCSLGRLIIDGHFLELGKRFAAKELLASPDDIFYLNLDEVRQIVAGGCAGNTCNNYRLRVAMRKREMSELAGMEVPELVLSGVASPSSQDE